MIFKTRLPYLWPLLLALALGCGGSNPNAPARVSGQVNYKGKPLPGGTISFHTEGSGLYNLAIGADGTYQGVDLPTGELVVTIETESLKAKHPPTQYGGKRGAQMMSPMPQNAAKQAPAEEYVKIPAKYSNPKTSGLIVTLSPGRQVHNFELQD